MTIAFQFKPRDSVSAASVKRFNVKAAARASGTHFTRQTLVSSLLIRCEDLKWQWRWVQLGHCRSHGRPQAAAVNHR